MLKKFLKDVLLIVVGKQAEGMSDLLYSSKHVNEFLIAKKLGITINQTRNILYKIADKGLVSSIRKKDKKKGWYTYFWKIEVLKSLEFLKHNLIKKLDQLHNQIKSRESKQFYVCEKCNLEFNEENALLHDFVCRECGSVFSVKDNSKVVKDFKKELNKLEKELEVIDAEIKEEKEREMKNKLKKEIKESKKKAKKVKGVKLRPSLAKAKKIAKKKIVKKEGISKKIRGKKAKKKIIKKKYLKKRVKKKSLKKKILRKFLKKPKKKR